MSNSVIIVAGGSGTRFGADIPKQFINLAGMPVIMHTIGVFHSFDPTLEIIVVLPKTQFGFWKVLCEEFNFNTKITVVEGGSERFHSVKNGLNAVTTNGIIAIHDAVRPLVSHETLQRCMDAARSFGNAVPVIPPVDSIRELTETGSTQVSREHFRLVQTPQCFQKEQILKAFEQEFTTLFTDDASVVEAAGLHINLVEGNRENMKITTPMDLTIAEVLIKQNGPE